MSGTLNKVILIGHLGEDPKIHYFESGNCIARFSLATNETYLNKNTNTKVTTTDWHTIIMRNEMAETCEKYLSKGDRIYLEGKIRTKRWTTEEGFEKQAVEIVVKEFKFLDIKSTKTDSFQQNQLEKQDKANNFIIPSENNDDVLPF